jgi:hypothetical protein
MRIALLSILAPLLALGVGAGMLGAQVPAPPARLLDSVRAEPSTVSGVTCYVHARYIVVERNVPDGVGADLFVRARATDRCDADSLAGDFVLRNEWAEYFLGLRGDVLFIDSGTGPDLRELILVDLRARRRLLATQYVALEPGPDSLTVGVWKGYELAEPAAGCSAPQGGLLPGVDSLFVVQVATGALRFGGRTRCAVRQ